MCFDFQQHSMPNSEANARLCFCILEYVILLNLKVPIVVENLKCVAYKTFSPQTLICRN